MAIIKCPECGKEVSDRAPACIHCGFPLNSEAAETNNMNKTFTVVLKSYGEEKVATIICIRKLTGLNVADAKIFVEGAPSVLKTNISLEEAQKIKSRLEAVGAVVDIVPYKDTDKEADVLQATDNGEKPDGKNVDDKNNAFRSSPEKSPPVSSNVKKGGNISSGFITLLIVLLLLWALSFCSKKSNPHDGKCDVCGKPATYSDSDEEYCSTHLRDAVKWYAGLD